MAIERVGMLCKRAAIFIFMIVSVVPALSSLSAGQVAPQWEFFGGYSYVRFDAPPLGYPSWTNLNGFNGEVTYNITHNFGVTADGSGGYGSMITAYNYMIGPQYSLRKDKSMYFAHAFIGKAENTVGITTLIKSGFESVGRAFAFGGGYDRDLTPRFTFRVMGDYLHTNTFGTTQTDVRVSTGLVFHIGHFGRRPKL
jgi:opacity protein-like surface antigen